MPRKARELSAIEVKRLRHPGHGRNAMVAVGGVGGLHLQISPAGARSWVLRVMVGEKRRHVGLGAYPEVPLAAARERAREARDMVRRGIDPVEHRKASAAALVAAQRQRLTFAEASRRFLAARAAEFSSEKHRRQWEATLAAYARPVLGDMPVADVAVGDVLRVLEPIWATKTETATRVRGRIEAVLSWAAVSGHRQAENPARWRGNLDALLPKPGRVAKAVNQPALTLADAAPWFADVRGRSGVATRALEFAALTVARSGEVRGAAWAEMDLDAGLWIVPAARMKARMEHRVALSDAAVALLRELPRFAGSAFVFPAARGGSLSDAALSACMKRVHEARPGGYRDCRSGRLAVPHGIRSTFRDWAAERTHWPREMAELALAHAVGSEVERAYRRGDMLEKRRAMMADWAAFLFGERTMTDGGT